MKYYEESEKYKVKNPLSEKTIRKLLNENNMYHKTHLITTDNKISLLKDEIEQINKW